MKKRRQEAILEIIEKYDLSTQDELLQKLRDSGFDATQATVSRDIKELRLVKTMGANGQYKYAVTKTESDELLSKFKSIFAQSVVSADFAGNIIAIRCYTGMAQAACAAGGACRHSCGRRHDICPLQKRKLRFADEGFHKTTYRKMRFELCFSV